MNDEEINILSRLANGDESALRYIFDLYYEQLFYFSFRIVSQKEIAEEIVQDVIISMWHKRKELKIRTSLKSYLYSATKNKSISHLRQKIRMISLGEAHVQDMQTVQTEDIQSIEYLELQEIIQVAISALPTKCKIIFLLSRNSGMSYKEIASELQISSESVKTQISIALKKIKTHLDLHWNCSEKTA